MTNLHEAPAKEKSIYRSPFRILIIIALSVYVSEISVMFFLSLIPPLSMWVEALIDSTLLVVLVSPILYFFLFHPLILHITERKRAEGLLKESEKQLLQSDKLATIGQLAAGVAHEINNPLGNISLYTQMLLKKTEDKNTEDKLKVINDEANRAAKIVKGLLDFARQSDPKLSPVDINKEIEKVLNIMNPQLKDIKADAILSPLPSILADSGQIQQVIMNLLANSIQAITENGEIIVKTNASKDHIEIGISDNGCGIPGENLDKIFDPFFTTKEQGKGTGLGLSICYGVVKTHKGSIDVKSEVGKGTTFTIKLPA